MGSCRNVTSAKTLSFGGWLILKKYRFINIQVFLHYNEYKYWCKSVPKSTRQVLDKLVGIIHLHRLEKMVLHLSSWLVSQWLWGTVIHQATSAPSWASVLLQYLIQLLPLGAAEVHTFLGQTQKSVQVSSSWICRSRRWGPFQWIHLPLPHGTRPMIDPGKVWLCPHSTRISLGVLSWVVAGQLIWVNQYDESPLYYCRVEFVSKAC